jgi:hypothetical protein
MKIRRFDESQSDFESLKSGVINRLDRLIEEYEDFTNDVSPKHWRTTGHHLTELKRMKEDISRISEITEPEKDIDWVRQNRNK